MSCHLVIAITIPSCAFLPFLPDPTIPLLSCVDTYSSCLGSKFLLDFPCCDIINNILSLDVTIFGNLNKLQLDSLGKIFIFKDGGVLVAIEMHWEISSMKIFVDPGVYSSILIDPRSLRLCNHQRCFMPSCHSWRMVPPPPPLEGQATDNTKLPWPTSFVNHT